MEGSKSHDGSFLGQQHFVPDVFAVIWRTRTAGCWPVRLKVTAAKYKPGKGIRELKITPQSLWWDLQVFKNHKSIYLCLLSVLCMAFRVSGVTLTALLSYVWPAPRNANLSTCPPALSPELYSPDILFFHTAMIFRVSEVLALRSAFSRSHTSL